MYHELSKKARAVAAADRDPLLKEIKVVSVEPGGAHGTIIKFNCSCLATANHSETWHVCLCKDHWNVAGAVYQIKRLVIPALKDVPVPQAAVAPEEQFELTG